MDVFNGWQDYQKRLTDNWNSLITDNDTVVIAGDISWAMKLEDTYTDFKFIISDQHQVFGIMNGTAILDDGTKLEVKDLLCFAEKVRNKY